MLTNVSPMLQSKPQTQPLAAQDGCGKNRPDPLAHISQIFFYLFLHFLHHYMSGGADLLDENHSLENIIFGKLCTGFKSKHSYCNGVSFYVFKIVNPSGLPR